MKKFLLFVIISILSASHASASGMKFGFTNPAFGGSPFNSTYLMGMADKQNEHQDPQNGEDLNSAEGFKKQLQKQLLSTTAGKISKLVTDSENPITEAVKYNIGDLSIEIIPINPDTGQYQIVINDGVSTTIIDVFNNLS